jgi:hypothetical protein
MIPSLDAAAPEFMSLALEQPVQSGSGPGTSR